MIGVIVLSAGLILTSVHRGAQAAPPPSNPGNPFQAILDKLDQVLAAITGQQATDLSGVTQNWDKVIPAAQRFVILPAFNSDAVLDRETGLVWEKSPLTGPVAWGVARIAVCDTKTTGGRKGWRLPSVHELASLVDPSVGAPGPILPPGHPFLNVQSAFYWSATTEADNPTSAWGVGFNVGVVGQIGSKTTGSFRVWCVRGGHNDGSEY
jgi:hypothetical protein